jgi:hypothetical protein
MNAVLRTALNKQKDEYLRNHREAQQRYREKLKSEIMNQLPPK